MASSERRPMPSKPSDRGTLALRILTAREIAKANCDCWEGCNDREGKLPCIHDILYEGVGLWAKKYGTILKARYK
jgi:hypothetical protein